MLCRPQALLETQGNDGNNDHNSLSGDTTNRTAKLTWNKLLQEQEKPTNTERTKAEAVIPDEKQEGEEHGEDDRASGTRSKADVETAEDEATE